MAKNFNGPVVVEDDEIEAYVLKRQTPGQWFNNTLGVLTGVDCDAELNTCLHVYHGTPSVIICRNSERRRCLPERQVLIVPYAMGEFSIKLLELIDGCDDGEGEYDEVGTFSFYRQDLDQAAVACCDAWLKKGTDSPFIDQPDPFSLPEELGFIPDPFKDIDDVVSQHSLYSDGGGLDDF